MTHSDSIAKWVSEGIAEKYSKGQEQHGGDVRRKNVLPAIAEELFDSLTYLAVLHEQFALILELAEMGLATGHGEDYGEYFSAIINIVRHGNEDGSKEEEREEEAKSLTFDKYYNKEIAERMFAWLTK